MIEMKDNMIRWHIGFYVYRPDIDDENEIREQLYAQMIELDECQYCDDRVDHLHHECRLFGENKTRTYGR